MFEPFGSNVVDFRNFLKNFKNSRHMRQPLCFVFVFHLRVRSAFSSGLPDSIFHGLHFLWWSGTTRSVCNRILITNKHKTHSFICTITHTQLSSLVGHNQIFCMRSIIARKFACDEDSATDNLRTAGFKHVCVWRISIYMPQWWNDLLKLKHNQFFFLNK